MFENKAHRKTFGVKRDEITGEWRKLHNAELHALYSSPNFIRNLKSRRLRCIGHVPHGIQKCIQSFSGETWRKETFREAET